MNAPRPLMGHKEWRGDFVCGVFYVALDPTSELYVDRLEHNYRQDATILEYVTNWDVVGEMLAYYKAQPELFLRLKKQGFNFNDPDIQEQLIQTWYNLEMNWSGT